MIDKAVTFSHKWRLGLAVGLIALHPPTPYPHQNLSGFDGMDSCTIRKFLMKMPFVNNSSKFSPIPLSTTALLALLCARVFILSRSIVPPECGDGASLFAGFVAVVRKIRRLALVVSAGGIRQSRRGDGPEISESHWPRGWAR